MHQFWLCKMVQSMAMENGTLKCTSFGNGKWYKVWRLNIVQRLAMENGTKIKLTEIGYLDNMNIAQ